jgi:hypothetical protein
VGRGGPDLLTIFGRGCLFAELTIGFAGASRRLVQAGGGTIALAGMANLRRRARLSERRAA